MNSAKFLPIFKQFFQGFHKEKELKIFLDILSNNNSSEGQNLKEKISFEHKLVENVVFIITSFSYYSSSWDNIHNISRLIFQPHHNSVYNAILILESDNETFS